MDGTSHTVARDNMNGALAMLAAIGLFIVNDALIKLASVGLPAAQTIGVRGVFATVWVLIAVLASGRGREIGRVVEPRTLGRALLDVASTFAYLVSLFHMPMPLAIAIGQTAPLMMLVLSVLFLGERVAWNRWLAVLVGLAAVLLVARPGGGGANGWAWLALLGTLMSALRDTYTRALPQRVNSLIVTLSTALAVTLVAMAITAAAGWVPMGWEQWGLLLAASVFLAGAYYAMILATRLGEVSFVGGFRYASLPAGALLGWAVWGDVPDGLAVIGMGVIVGAGLYLFHSGRRSA